MKKKLKTTVFFAILLILAGFLTSFEKEKVCEEEKACECGHEKNSTFLVGNKWKLEFIVGGYGTPSVNYSQYNIVYEFKENNVLVVSGKLDIADDRILGPGEHFYDAVWVRGPVRSTIACYPLIKIGTVIYRRTLGSLGANIPGTQLYDIPACGNPSFSAYIMYFSIIN